MYVLHWLVFHRQLLDLPSICVGVNYLICCSGFILFQRLIDVRRICWLDAGCRICWFDVGGVLVSGVMDAVLVGGGGDTSGIACRCAVRGGYMK